MSNPINPTIGISRIRVIRRQTVTPFQSSMAEIRTMASNCNDREEVAYMYRNMIQFCCELSKEHGFSLKEQHQVEEGSALRRTYDSNLKEARRNYTQRNKAVIE